MAVSGIIFQMITLFIMMFAGYLAARAGLISPSFRRGLSSLVLSTAFPCCIVSSVLQSGGAPGDMVVALGVSVAFFALLIALAAVLVCIVPTPKPERSLDQLMLVFTNLAFMGIPIIQAFYGAQGVAMLSMFLLVFNFLVFTYGVMLVSGNGSINLRQLVNPGVVSALIALLFGLTGWRWVIIFGALCSLIIWVIRKKLPESARWLEEKGRHEEAHKVMCEMEQRCGVSPSPRHRIETQHNRRRLGSFKAIWAPQYRKRTIMLMVMNFFQAIGFFGFGNWLPALLSGQGASITHSLLYAFFITLAYPIGCLFCTRFVHRFENKWQIVLSALMTVVFGTLFALQNSPVLLVICGFMITWSNAWLTISYHAYQAEVFPTHIRARAVGFCYSFSRLSTAITSILIGVILQYAGTPGVISFIVASMLMVMLSVGIFGPKTRGISLENI